MWAGGRVAGGIGAGVGSDCASACSAVGLADAACAGPCVSGVGEEIAHVVKDDEADGVAQIGKCGRWQAQLGRVGERSRTTDLEAGFRIARPGSVLRKSAEGNGAAGVETLGQRDDSVGTAAVGANLAVTRVASDDVAAFTKAVVAGVRCVDAIELGFRAEEAVREKFLKAGVGAAARVHGEVASVANPG